MCLKDFEAVKVGAATVFHGSNLDVLPFMADNSVDSIVCDPPYELGFMGKSWDSSGIAYSVELWRECLRVLKPGGHLLAFGGSRTWHRLAVAIEDAGFDLRDSIAWLYGSGFPKSHNVALGIDKKLGHENRGRAIPVASKFQASDVEEKNKLTSNPVDAYAARSPEAEKWAGWGTALKPAFEPVVVARKPLVGTVAENVLAWGVGGLNIDASRIDYISEKDKQEGQSARKSTSKGFQSFTEGEADNFDRSNREQIQGRWPANIILDEYTAGLLDEQAEDVSRFFYVAKASKRDRNEGLEELPKQMSRKFAQDETTLATMPFGKEPVQNFHPTVKPTELMRYLIKLVTPAGGIVLDPFTGSGSTGKAALLDGYRFVGIELTADYLPIIEGRLRWADQEHRNQIAEAEAKENETLF